MELQIRKLSDQASEDVIQISDATFGREFNETLVHQVVVAQLAAARSGTKAQKTRSQVRGGGSKPWRQKGTGRARAGSIRSPIWRGGGVVHAASPRNHAQKVNKKMYRVAMQVIFSELMRQERLVVVDELSVAEPRTKLMNTKLGELGVGNVLLVTENVDQNLYLAARNLPHVDVRDVSGLDPVSLVGFEQVVITAAALKRVEAWLS